jgi:hypothetical protein
VWSESCKVCKVERPRSGPVNKLTLPSLFPRASCLKPTNHRGPVMLPTPSFRTCEAAQKIVFGLSPPIRKRDSKNNNLHHVRLVSLDQRQRLSKSAFGENERVAMRRSENDRESEEVEMAKRLSIHLHYIGHTQYLSLRHTHHRPPEHTIKVPPLLLLTTSINSPTG